MVVFYTRGKYLVVIAHTDEQIPLEITAMADYVSIGDKVIKNRWARS